MKSRLFKRAYLFVSSPKLTLAILVYSTFLLFGATLMQSQIGIAEMQGRYVESFIFLASPFFWSSSFLSAIKFPLFGGAFVGTLAVVNLIASCMRYAKFGIQGFGVSITHMAIVLLIVSGALQYFMRVEGRISLREGVPANLVYTGSGSKTITLPFSVTLKQFKDEKWAGSDIAKEYSSQIYFERGGSREDAEVSVNSPVSFGGWTFYQMSYGDGGKTSILGVVRNPARLLPWLSVGATFLGMLVIFLPRAVFGRRSNEN